MEFGQVQLRSSTISPALVREPLHDLTQPPDGHFMMNEEKREDFFQVLSSVCKNKGKQKETDLRLSNTNCTLSRHNARSPPGSLLFQQVLPRDSSCWQLTHKLSCHVAPFSSSCCPAASQLRCALQPWRAEVESEKVPLGQTWHTVSLSAVPEGDLWFR